MQWLKFRPLKTFMIPKYVEFHEDSESGHESSRNCDPMRKFKENPKHIKIDKNQKWKFKKQLFVFDFSVFLKNLLWISISGALVARIGILVKFYVLYIS